MNISVELERSESGALTMTDTYIEGGPFKYLTPGLGGPLVERILKNCKHITLSGDVPVDGNELVDFLSKKYPDALKDYIGYIKRK
jgi:hypothetical protein